MLLRLLPPRMHASFRPFSLFLCLAALVFCNVNGLHANEASAEESAQPGFTITIAIPKNTPSDAAIYVAGSFNNWQTDLAAYRLQPASDGRYAITLPAAVRGHIEFKFTLGTWSTGEVDTNGVDTPNRQAEIPAKGTAKYEGEVHAWHLSAKNIPELQAQLEKILQRNKVPGLAVSVIKKDQADWIAGLGVADVASKRASEATSLFRIGSISKNFTALAILKLVREGKLSLHDSVRKLIPEVAFTNPWEATDPVRVSDLLEHTTGWEDMHFSEYAKNAPTLSLIEALAFRPATRTSRWRPGTRFSYNNIGPAVAAAIVEKVSKRNFEEYIRTEFFSPIGMPTATYHQPAAEQAASLYQSDGITPYPYWHILFRPAGSINASATDMAAYLHFFLQRGSTNGNTVLPASFIDQVETPTRTLAAQQGLRTGYALYNEAIMQDGFVLRGHSGGVEGGLSSLAYMPEHGAGYFFSINAGNGKAFEEINAALRAYITQGLPKPSLPAVAPLPANAASFDGWYQTAAPRNESLHFLERFFSLLHFQVVDAQLKATTLVGQETRFIPVGGNLFRLAPDPLASLALIPPHDDGQFIIGSQTLQRIPTWLVVLELVLVAWFALALCAIVISLPVFVVMRWVKKWRRPVERWLFRWPVIALLSLLAMLLIFHLAGEQTITRLGNLSMYSGGIWLFSLLFAAAVLANSWRVWTISKTEIRSWVRVYAWFVAPPLLVCCVYLSYWGVIGIRFWD